MKKFLFFALVLFAGIQSSAAVVDGLYYNTFGNPSDKAIVFVHGGPGYNSWSFENAVAAE